MRLTGLWVAPVMAVVLLVTPPVHAQDVQTLVSIAQPSVAIVLARTPNGIASGTGFLVADRVVLTARHVVAGADRIFLKFPQTEPVEAQVTVSDPDSDVAVLSIPSLPIRPLPLGDSAAVRAGQTIVVIGFPRIEALGAETSTVTEGIVSAVRQDALQIQAPINPGNSGGPVLDLQGRVIGIVESTLRGGQLINFATPISAAKVLLRAQPSKAASPSARTEDAIRATVLGWASTLRDGDLNQHMGYYASSLYVYFTKRNVSWQFILGDKKSVLQQYPHIIDYTIRNLDVTMVTYDLAIVTFDKSWDARTADNRRFAGDEKQRLKLLFVDGRWRIVSEEELKVYWVVRP